MECILKRFTDIILAGMRDGVSDIHVVGGQPLVFRKNGVIFFERSIMWTPQEVDKLAQDLLTIRHTRILKKRWSIDLALSIEHIRVRINIFNTTRGLSLSVRILPGSVPTVRDLNLHPSISQISDLNAGLILICGTTGCGKSTTIAAIIDEINRKRSVHIVTLEDPIEFRFVPKASFVEQRELGTHVPSFKQGLLDVLREDPDVIVVGELREPETMRLTINAAESGHLVIATLHATNAEDAMYRICNSFPLESQEEIRFQLASALSWLIVQQLVYLDRFRFRIPLLSIMKCTRAVKMVLRENRLNQIENLIHISKSDGMFSMERYRDEFIEANNLFINPVNSFRPSEELAKEADWHTPLINPDAAATRDDMEELHDMDSIGFGPDMSMSPAGRESTMDIGSSHDDSFHYVIEEETNLEDVLKQIKQTESKK